MSRKQEYVQSLIVARKRTVGLPKPLEEARARKQMADDLFYLRTDRNLTIPTAPFKVYDKEELERDCGKEWEIQLTLESYAPFWVANIPGEFYDFEDSETGKWDNYDLFMPGYGEVLSGARREFEYGKIVRKMEMGGVRKENYRVLLKMAKKGRLKPSAGAGIGLERLVSWIVDAKHVGEVQLFPRIPGTVHEL